MAKKSLSRALDIWNRRSVSRLLRSKMLYTLGRSQLILRASDEGVRSCVSSSCLMSLPICTIKNVELLLLVSTIKGSRIAYLNQRTSNIEAHVDMAYPSALWAPPLIKGRNRRYTSVSLHHAKVRIIFHLAKNYDKKIRLTHKVSLIVICY